MRICSSTSRCCWLVVLLCSVCPLVGCNSKPDSALVSGVVMLDGQPLDDAIVEFHPSGGFAPTSLNVIAGKFSGSVAVGEKKVCFFAMRATKRDPSLGPTDAQNPVDNILPDRYGYESAIKLNVGTDKSIDLKYELLSND